MISIPICKVCKRMLASVEMRKSKQADGGHVCKDKRACKDAVRQQKGGK